MRVHTNLITLTEIWRITYRLSNVFMHATEHGSRSHKRAFEVRLEGNGHRRNTGQHGADSHEYGATWDEWGVVIARLYALDPDALWGTAKYPEYRHAADFHRRTGDRFRLLELPADTHKRHTWKWDADGATCGKCSAIIRRRDS